jgi:hypothetical protein
VSGEREQRLEVAGAGLEGREDAGEVAEEGAELGDEAAAGEAGEGAQDQAVADAEQASAEACRRR